MHLYTGHHLTLGLQTETPTGYYIYTLHQATLRIETEMPTGNYLGYRKIIYMTHTDGDRRPKKYSNKIKLKHGGWDAPM